MRCWKASGVGQAELGRCAADHRLVPLVKHIQPARRWPAISCWARARNTPSLATHCSTTPSPVVNRPTTSCTFSAAAFMSRVVFHGAHRLGDVGRQGVRFGRHGWKSRGCAPPAPAWCRPCAPDARCSARSPPPATKCPARSTTCLVISVVRTMPQFPARFRPPGQPYGRYWQNVFRGAAHSLGQLAHFIGHHGKTAPGLTSAQLRWRRSAPTDFLLGHVPPEGRQSTGFRPIAATARSPCGKALHGLRMS